MSTMIYSRLLSSDYQEIPAQKLAEVNQDIELYNSLVPRQDSLIRQRQDDSSRQSRIFYITWPISALVALIVLGSIYNDLTFSMLGWSVFIGLLIAGMAMSSIKTADTSSISSQMSQLSSKINLFKKTVENQRLKNSIDYWINMSGYEFERQVASLYSVQGYSSQVTRGSGDGGVDIYLSKDGIRYAVQCKNHKKPIGPSAVRDLYGAMTHGQITRGIFISSGGYTTGAKEFAHNKIELLDIHDVIRMHKASLSRVF